MGTLHNMALVVIALLQSPLVWGLALTVALTWFGLVIITWWENARNRLRWEAVQEHTAKQERTAVRIPPQRGPVDEWL